jgi:Protein of unknown function (DUF3175)
MLNYFINRAGRGLQAKRRAELEKAKSLQSRRVKEGESAESKSCCLSNTVDSALITSHPFTQSPIW